MPEYLAPGVYIEEIEIGAKPIEGVSTSTAGFLGYTERGPLNKPTLVTSSADFERKFGGFLPTKENGKDFSKIRWLAYAVSGFFENGGKRAYITRVALEGSAEAKDNAAAAAGSLPRLSLSEDGTLPALDSDVQAKAVALKLKEDTPGDWSDKNVLLLEDGVQSEYLTFKGAAKKISLKDSAKLAKAYDAGTKIIGGTKPDNATTTITTAVSKGASTVELNSVNAVSAGDCLLIVDGAKGNEVIVVKKKTIGTKITTKESLRSGHATGLDVFKLTISETTLVLNAAADATEFYVDNSTTLADDDYIVVGSECPQIDAPANATDIFQISPALKYTHKAGKGLVKLVPAVKVTASSEGTWGNSIKVAVKQSSLSITELTQGVAKSNRLDLETITGIEPGSLLKLPTATPQYVTVKETHKTSTDIFVILKSNFTGTLNVGDEVKTEEFSLIVTDGKNGESFNNLSLNEEHSRYIKKIVTEKSSNLIRIGDITGTPPHIPLPTPDDMPGWLLEEGNDGFPADPAEDTDLNPIYEGKDNTEPDKRSGLHTFKNVDEINIVAIPGITTKYLQQKVITHCEVETKDRFAVLDSSAKADLDETKTQRNLFDTSYAALYYPWIYAFDPLSKEYINIPPSGHVCGVYARTDVERGVHKAPANEKINGVVNLEKLNGKFRIVNKGTQEILNPLGVNCIRPFPGRGIRVWGARTVSSNSLWKYINVRRLFLYLEESIEEGTQWVVFEPNNEKLWARVKQTITQFLTRVWKDGALMGLTPDEAFFVKCDRTTMTQDDLDNGRLIVLIGVAPVKPAEFVVFRIAQWASGSEVTE